MNNQNSIGVVLLLLLVFAALDGGNAGPVPGSAAAPVRPPARPPHPAALAKDFHRMVGIMGKVDNLGQMALTPQKLPKPPKASEPESLINASALPDLSGIMDMLGPIMSGLGGASDE